MRSNQTDFPRLIDRLIITVLQEKEDLPRQHEGI